VETQEGDVAAYIPTNVISITDGQIFLESNLFNSGVKPAVNAGISVSRVGGSAQIPAMKKIAGGLRLGLASYRSLAAFAQFGSDLDKATQQELTRGERLVEILKQGQYVPQPVEQQVTIIYAGTSGGLDEVPALRVQEFEKLYHESIQSMAPQVLEEIRTTKQVSDAARAAMDKVIASVKSQMQISKPQVGDAASASAPKSEQGKSGAGKTEPRKEEQPKPTPSAAKPGAPEHKK
jgi:F-type H+-transporting ATPase subunit alpha